MSRLPVYIWHKHTAMNLILENTLPSGKSSFCCFAFVALESLLKALKHLLAMNSF